jgi:drug/metabolite transporter (DMT)-like permease
MIRKGFKRSSHADTGFFMTIVFNVVVLAVIFLIIQIFTGFSFELSWTALLFFTVAGILTTGLGRLTFFGSITRIGPSSGSAIKNGSPIFTVIFAVLVLAESFSWTSIWGIMMLLGAILLQGITFVQLQKKRMKEIVVTTEQQGDFHTQWVGYLLGMLSALSFGIGFGVRKQGLLFLNDAFFGALIGALTSLIFFLIYEGFRGQLILTIKRNFTVLNPYYLAVGIMTSFGSLFFFLGASHIQVAYVSV